MIEIKDLRFRYRKSQPLFEDLNIHLEPGLIHGLLGKNGAGKTSLLKIISGLLFPKSGACSVEGHAPRQRKPSFLGRIFFIPEEFALPSLSILGYESLYSCFYPDFKREVFAGILSEFGLSQTEKLHRLSHGQRKKFLIAFGLATDCRILLMDEPTNGLDIPGKSAFRRIIARSIREDRVFVISTHQVRDVENLIDTVVLLEQGRIVFHRTVAEISERLRFSTQGDPGGGVLYSEKTPLGERTLSRNRGGEASAVDLEILFNAIVADPASVDRVFTEEPARAE